MDVTISQVRERTPIQIQGMVTVFRNWLNWWYVNAAKTKKCKIQLSLFTNIYTDTDTDTHLSRKRWRSSLDPAAGQTTQLFQGSREPRLPAPPGNTATTTAWSLSKAERQWDDSVAGKLWQGGGQRFAICVCCMYTVHHTIVADIVCLA